MQFFRFSRNQSLRGVLCLNTSKSYHWPISVADLFYPTGISDQNVLFWRNTIFILRAGKIFTDKMFINSLEKSEKIHSSMPSVKGKSRRTHFHEKTSTPSVKWILWILWFQFSHLGMEFSRIILWLKCFFPSRAY